LQQTRKQLRELEMGVQEQQHSLDQLAAERDACKSGAHEAADRSKVHILFFWIKARLRLILHFLLQFPFSLPVAQEPAARFKRKTVSKLNLKSPMLL